MKEAWEEAHRDGNFLSMYSPFSLKNTARRYGVRRWVQISSIKYVYNKNTATRENQTSVLFQYLIGLYIRISMGFFLTFGIDIVEGILWHLARPIRFI